MWIDLLPGQAEAQEGVGGDGGGGAGQQPPEGVGAVAGQFHLVGDLLERGFDAVAPLGDDLQQGGWHAGALVFGGWQKYRGAAGLLFSGERLPGEALVHQQVSRWRPGVEQVRGDVALVDGGGHDAPGPHDAAAEVGLDREPEPVEPFGVRAVAAEPGRQAVAWPGPAVAAADPGRVFDRQRGGIHLLAAIGGQPARQVRPELLEGSPQPADSPVGLGLVRQAREQVGPIAADFCHEPGLAAAAQQVAHQCDGQQFGIAAGGHRAGTGRDRDGPRADRVINKHVNVDEQILGWQHGDGLCGTTVLDNRLSPAEATSRSRRHAGINPHKTPQTINPMDVTMNVTPPKSWGKIAGVVSGKDCTGKISPLRGVVFADGKQGFHFTLPTDKNGNYSFWAPAGASPFAMTASANGWIPQSTSANIRGGKTTTVNFTLRPTSC